MARSKSPYDFLNEHIRGICFPLHYEKPAPVRMSLSRSAFQNRPFEAVVKIVSHIKAGRGPLRAMTYLAEKSAGLVSMFHGFSTKGFSQITLQPKRSP